jgi:LysM repeat protein
MQTRIGLVALGAIASLVLVSGNTAHAKSDVSEKKNVKSSSSTKKTEPKKVIVTIKAGDTLSAIADKYKTSYIRIFDANENIKNPDMIDVNWKVRIPAKDEKLKDRLSEMSAANQIAITVGSAPRAGAIGEEPGHVVYVESVNGSMVTISEMNYNGGVGVVHRRTVPASEFRYIY